MSDPGVSSTFRRNKYIKHFTQNRVNNGEKTPSLSKVVLAVVL
jgi:hypothetical protein